MRPFLLDLWRLLGRTSPLLWFRVLGWLVLALLAVLVLRQRAGEQAAARLDRAVFRAELRDSMQRATELGTRQSRRHTDSVLTRQEAVDRAFSDYYRRLNEKHTRHYRAARVPLPAL